MCFYIHLAENDVLVFLYCAKKQPVTCNLDGCSFN